MQSRPAHIGYAAVIGMACALLGAPSAQADDLSFVNEAHALGFPQAADSLIRMGRSACYFLTGFPTSTAKISRDPAEVAQRIMRYANVGPDQARQFLGASVNEYCPQDSYRLSGPT